MSFISPMVWVAGAAAFLGLLLLIWSISLWRRLAHVTVEAAVQAERLAQLQSRAQSLDEQLAMQTGALQQAHEQLHSAERAYTELQVRHDEKLAALRELRQAFEESKVMLRTEFQGLASQILEEKGRAFSASSQASLDQLLRPFREQIDGFQRRINEVHDASLRGRTQLAAEIDKVMQMGVRMSAEANSLALALKGDKKTTGNWGEVQLARSLELAGLVAGDHYQAQAAFSNEAGQRRQPDFVINLPDGKHLIIDSKVSLVDYEAALSAADEAARDAALAAHVRAVRRHIDDLAVKDYSNLIGMRSPSFVLMFMPIEPAYIEAMRQSRDLFDYGYQRNVILVSHTTLMPVLRTVANLWMIARSNEQTRALADLAGGLYNQVALVAERLRKLGHTLGTVAAHYNGAVTAVTGQQGLYGKVQRFSELSAKANRELPAIDMLRPDLETGRLEATEAPPVPSAPPAAQTGAY